MDLNSCVNNLYGYIVNLAFRNYNTIAVQNRSLNFKYIFLLAIQIKEIGMPFCNEKYCLVSKKNKIVRRKGKI